MTELKDPKIIEIDKIKDNMERSLQSTINGLKLFVDSLEKSGMRGSISEYKKLQAVLIQQKLWSEKYEQKTLQPMWIEISIQASKLSEIFDQFSQIMSDLKRIDTISANPNAHTESRTDEYKIILNILSRHRYFSLDKLSLLSNLDKKTILKIIDQLSENELIEKKNHGKNIQIKLRDDLALISNL